jgi:hypothetical protein
MAGRTPPNRKLENRRQSGTRVLGAALAMLALCLRLAWPGPAVPPAPDASLAAALGEHALCLAASLIDEKVPLPRDQDSPQPGDHADHGGLGCCPWHAAAGFTLPQITAVARVAFVEIRIPRLKTLTSAGLLRPIGPLQARAPPEAT